MKLMEKNKYRVGIVSRILFFSIFFSLIIPPVVHPFSLTLAWDPSADSNVVGYKIYVSNLSKKYYWSLNVGNNTFGTVGNLVEGKLYFFAVTAYNDKGLESSYSNEVQFPDLPIKYYFPISPLTTR